MFYVYFCYVVVILEPIVSLSIQVSYIFIKLLFFVTAINFQIAQLEHSGSFHWGTTKHFRVTRFPVPFYSSFNSKFVCYLEFYCCHTVLKSVWTKEILWFQLDGFYVFFFWIAYQYTPLDVQYWKRLTRSKWPKWCVYVLDNVFTTINITSLLGSSVFNCTLTLCYCAPTSAIPWHKWHS